MINTRSGHNNTRASVKTFGFMLETADLPVDVDDIQTCSLSSSVLTNVQHLHSKQSFISRKPWTPVVAPSPTGGPPTCPVSRRGPRQFRHFDHVRSNTEKATFPREAHETRLGLNEIQPVCAICMCIFLVSSGMQAEPVSRETFK